MNIKKPKKSLKYVKSISRGKNLVRISKRIYSKPYPISCQKTFTGNRSTVSRVKNNLTDDLLLLHGVTPKDCKLVKHIFINYKRDYIIKREGIISDGKNKFGLSENQYQITLFIDKLIVALGNIRVANRDAQQVKNDWNNCLSYIRSHNKKSFSNDITTYGCAAFNVARDDGLVAFNPVDTTSVNKLAKTKRKRKLEHTDIELTQNDFEEFLDILPYAYWPFIISADNTPLRVREGINAKRPSINSISAEKIPIKSEKLEPNRNIYINPCLDNFMKGIPENINIAFPILKNSQLIPINYFVFRRVFKIAAIYIGKPHLRIHDFRAFSSSRMKKFGMSNAAIQECGGWLDIGSFEKFYFRNSDNEGHAATRFTEILRKAFIRLGYDPDDLVFAPPNTPADGFAWYKKEKRLIYYKDDLKRVLIEMTNQ